MRTAIICVVLSLTPVPFAVADPPKTTGIDVSKFEGNHTDLNSPDRVAKRIIDHALYLRAALADWRAAYPGPEPSSPIQADAELAAAIAFSQLGKYECHQRTQSQKTGEGPFEFRRRQMTEYAACMNEQHSHVHNGQGGELSP